VLEGVPQRLGRSVGAAACQRLWARLVTSAERKADKLLFHCQACGHCLLFQTVFICPATCTRGLRNGPCRGSTPGHCFVDPTRRCVWFAIYQRAERQGTLDRLLEVNPPLDLRCRADGVSLTAHQLGRERGQGPRLRDLIVDRTRFNSDWEVLHNQLRQLDWWQGDSRYHPPTYTEPVSQLEMTLRSGRFVVSVEVAPPMEPSGLRIAQVAERLEGCVDTLNFTDNPRGVARMSGLACAVHSLANGLEPVLQIQTRYRGRYELESDVVGAGVMGVHNILCLSDDTGRLGPGPRPTPGPCDLDTVQALWMLRRLRDEGVNVDGQAIEHRPRYFLGAMASPYAALPRYEAIITEKKINAGAQFLQTLPVFDLGRFAEWMAALSKRDLLGKAYLMVTVSPLKSASHARFMATEVPGGFVPPAIRARVENATDAQEEGMQIALEIISELKKMDWIHGLHILVPEREEVASRLVEEAGLKNFTPRVDVKSGNGHTKSNPDRSATPDAPKVMRFPLADSGSPSGPTPAAP